MLYFYISVAVINRDNVLTKRTPLFRETLINLNIIIIKAQR
nr:MAG TPA: hypothetical protein [Caudoviricetes sp.]